MGMMKRLRAWFATLSNDNKLLISLFCLLFIIWIIFDPIKFSWADDPFQKVVLAPLGEEPFKLLLAFLVLSVIPGENYFIRRHSKRANTSPSKKQKRLRHFTFPTLFSYSFVPLAIVFAASFGMSEGSFRNIVLHVSLSSLAAILIVEVFTKVKNNPWKLRYKLLSVFSTIALPMFLHSISNQYANISYANSQPEFEYLVVIGRFLQDNTFLSNQAMFTVGVFIVTYIILFAWIYRNILIPLHQKKGGKLNKTEGYKNR